MAMNLEKAIDIMSKEIVEKKHISISLQNGLFDLTIIIKPICDKDEIHMRIESDNYSCLNCNCNGDSSTVYCSRFSKIEDTIRCLYNITSSEGF